MSENPEHLDNSHPVAEILHAAALFGEAPSKAKLDKLRRDDVPDDCDLHRFRRLIVHAANDIVAARHAGGPNSVNGRGAQQRRDHHLADLALRMTSAERAVTGEEHPEDLDSITSRMFGGY